MTDRAVFPVTHLPDSPPLLRAAIRGLFCMTVSSCADSGGNTGKIVSSRVDETVTLESFTEECDERGGALETHASCGGANTCAGFSYDTDTHVFTEHTCKGANTCPGFSCVLPKD